MDKRRTEDEETLEGIQHFSNYMHEIGDGTELGQATNTIVRNACKVVGHIADGILHAIESLELNEDKKD